MQEKNYTGIIPEQESGASIDVKSTVELDTTEAAKIFFQEARNRLLHVNDWHELAGSFSATFQLTDKDGNEVQGEAKQGYYLKIDIPGPGSASGEGYDWVIIEAVENTTVNEIESVGIRVRPVRSPLNTEKDVAHFYSEASTSNFTVTRENKTVTAAIYDRNTQTNSGSSEVKDKIRDAVVGAAAITGFSKLQWKKLADGLLEQ
jgi:hypothetical protein